MSRNLFDREDAERAGWTFGARFGEHGRGFLPTTGPPTAAVHPDGRTIFATDPLGLLANIAEIEGRGFLHGYGLPVDAPCVHAVCCGGKPDFKRSPKELGRA